MHKKIIEVFNKKNICLTPAQANQFELYFNFLIQENEKFNLTAITQEDEVFYKHFLDSVLPVKELKQNSSLIDVGTGAGFPGIPLKILRPDLKVTLLDSLQKRVNFLNETIRLLGLKNIEAVHARAEDYVREKREKFDYAVSRAVAKTNTLLEYLLPYIKVGGSAFLYKSQKYEEELIEAKVALNELGGKLEKVLDYKIEKFDAERKIVVIRKIKNTPVKYPRGKNLPKTRPLL